MTDDHKLVYLVHNDSDVLLSIYDVLSGAGFRVSATSNALDALAYIARARPRAVLCRFDMPEMGGDEFIMRAKRISPETRLLICSRMADERLYECVLRLGANDLVREPLSPSAVLQAVSRMVGLAVPYDDSKYPASLDAGPGWGWGNGKTSA